MHFLFSPLEEDIDAQIEEVWYTEVRYFIFSAISEAIVHIFLSLTQKPISESDI